MRVGKRWIVLAAVFIVWTAAAGLAAYVLGRIHQVRMDRQENDMLIDFRIFEQCSFSIGELRLKEGQWQKYRAVGDSARPELDQLKARFREKKAHLLQLIYGPADSAAVRADLEAIAGLQSEFERRMVRYIMDLRALLTEQQLKKFDRWVKRAVCPWL